MVAREAIHGLVGAPRLAVGVQTMVKLYGSRVTFAGGQRVSAPGQIPIGVLRAAKSALGEASFSA